MKKYILGIISGLIISIVFVSGAVLYQAKDIEYIDTNGNNTNVQSALNNLFNYYSTLSTLKLNIIVIENDYLPEKAKNNDIAIYPYTQYNNKYLISNYEPENPENGMIWINFNDENSVTLTIENTIIPLGLCYQYSNGEWNIIKSYIYHDKWELYSDGFNNWKILASLANLDYNNYQSLNDLLSTKGDIEKILNNSFSLDYLLNSQQLIKDIKNCDNYINNFVPTFLSFNDLTNKQKYSYNLPFYIFNNGVTEYSFTAGSGCNLTPGYSTSTSSIGTSISLNFIGSTNCCGGRRVYTTTKFDLTNYSTISFNINSFSASYSEQQLTIGTYNGGYYIDGKGVTNSGLFNYNISNNSNTLPIGIATYTCNNYNNTTTGSTIRGGTNKIYLY